MKLFSFAWTVVIVGWLLSCAGFASIAWCDDALVGLRSGTRLEPFYVKDCTGPAAGKTLCYYCQYGPRPVAALFVRAWSDEVTELVVQLDRKLAHFRGQRMAGLVVFIGQDTQALEQQLKTLAAANGIQDTPLTIYRDAPEKLERVLGLAPRASLAAYTWRNAEIQNARVYSQRPLAASERHQILADVNALVSP